MRGTTTMKWIDGKWQCNNCRMKYEVYTTYCRDGCLRQNMTGGDGNLIKN